MNIDRYSGGNSSVHKWDSRFKIISFLSLVFPAVLVNGISVLIGLLVFVFIIILLARLPLSFVSGILKTPAGFVLLMSPSLIFFSGGDVFFSCGILNIYSTGLHFVIRVFLKAIIITSIFLLIFGTTRFYIVMKALGFFKFPKNLLLIMQFTFRYIFLYTEDVRKLSISARLRSGGRKKSVMHIRTTAAMFVTLLLRSYEQSERVYTAMKIRGFRGNFRSLDEFDFNHSDVIKSFLLVSFSFLFILAGKIL